MAQSKGKQEKESFSDERYRTFIETIHDGVYETDMHGNFIYFNKAFCRVFGYPPEEILHQNFSKFMDRANARKAYDAFSKVWITHQGFSDILWEIVDKDKKVRVIELSASLIRNKKGRKVGFRGVARDVTEKIRAQEALKESEQRYQKAYEASRRAERWARSLLDFVPYPMVVFSEEGKVTYLNPAFTETFGWELSELQGKRIPYVPPDLEEAFREDLARLKQEKFIRRIETRRLTKDGRVLDVNMRAALISRDDIGARGELVILRDITEEKRIARNNEALLRISTSLPAHPDLEELLDYISAEVKGLVTAEGVVVILLDEEKGEFFFKGAAYDDHMTQKRIKEMRFPSSRGLAGKVVATGEPLISNDTSREADFENLVDQAVGFQTRSILEVPLRSRDRIVGVLCAMNKKHGPFDQWDVELLSTLSGTVALSIENARFADELKRAYQEVSSLNRAKDRVINHLSHELKTPLSVLLSSLKILKRRLRDIPEKEWLATVERAERNLNRLLEIQYQAEDIMRDRRYSAHRMMSGLLECCADALEALVAEETGEGGITARIREKIDELFLARPRAMERIDLAGFVRRRLEVLAPAFSHRRVKIRPSYGDAPPVCLPRDVLEKVVDGVIRNAVENTPDEGLVEVEVAGRGSGTRFEVRDYGVGITEENRRRIFEGFFPTHETMSYSSKKPFDFNAGGRGADLLRMKIFAERYGFEISMESERCRFIPTDADLCPGRIADCTHCESEVDCRGSGGTAFRFFFPAVRDEACRPEREDDDSLRLSRGDSPSGGNTAGREST
ncbi:MAG: PAS domain S-box protein [Deltaproteobacteria bacterium]|nr:PAS domain S-box protein [Deltaproteobacteria bacterium]MBW1923502.1 PAS domain S-box protein [Deltaproteobacteria bacterium]MBW1949887.1 PAS domain S-box protein [Deltaproteobacteria bacterium]MBW2008491.1 PAS domain S-box protein [Deltaproteobacteria bacterium]MBW2101382.1 PAS domain S-box protein [Deltaproteobacteria bacterium]